MPEGTETERVALSKQERVKGAQKGGSSEPLEPPGYGPGV